MKFEVDPTGPSKGGYHWVDGCCNEVWKRWPSQALFSALVRLKVCEACCEAFPRASSIYMRLTLGPKVHK